MEVALARGPGIPSGRFRLPEALPPFNTPAYRVFSIVWIAAFLLAIIGPVMGLVQRYETPSNNSQLLLGSRVGLAVSPGDATNVRFPVGAQAKAAGVQPGDRIIAVYGLPLPKIMPMTEQAVAQHADDAGYVVMQNLLYGTEETEVPITLRHLDGRTIDVTLTASERHIDDAATGHGISPKLLSFIDLLPLISYPFLLWAAWILHRRNSRDIVSSILSLAILLTMSAEQPSIGFLTSIGVPRRLNVGLYDLGNVLLLAGILLFPHGKLSWKLIGLLACLPVLMLLHGIAYQSYFVGFFIIAVLLLLRCMRRTPESDLLQQIRWALFGFSGYAALRGLSMLCDLFKWSTGNFPQQMLVEMLAGVSAGLGTLVLQLGLLIALLRYRLYDADSIIGRTVSVAIVTLVISGGFAGIMEGIITSLQFIYPESDTSQTVAAMAGAIFAASCIEPVRDRAREWTERRFQKNLFLLREDLPESVRDLRETASLEEMLETILTEVDHGVRSVRSAMIVNGCVMAARGLPADEVEQWRTSTFAQDYKRDICEPSDKLFPIRVPLVPSSDREEPIGFILVGPRPDGSIASKKEQEALAEVSEGIARAIRAVIKREAREAEISEIIGENSRRIEALEALLSGAAPRKRGPRTA
jgi:hypothetical protein